MKSMVGVWSLRLTCCVSRTVSGAAEAFKGEGLSV